MTTSWVSIYRCTITGCRINECHVQTIVIMLVYGCTRHVSQTLLEFLLGGGYLQILIGKRFNRIRMASGPFQQLIQILVAG